MSGGLVRHHFGSKEGLRDACDAYALDQLMRLKEQAVVDGHMAAPGFLAGAQPTLLLFYRYLARSMLDGSPAAAAMFDEMVDLGERWLAEHHPGWIDDQRAYSALLVAMELGALSMNEQLSHGWGPISSARRVTCAWPRRRSTSIRGRCSVPELAAQAHAAIDGLLAGASTSSSATGSACHGGSKREHPRRRPHRGPDQALRHRGRAARSHPRGRARRGARLPRARTGRARRPRSGCCSGLIRPTAGRAEIFGLDCQRSPVEAHRRLAYVPGEANLWPSLTGAETLHLLGRVQGEVDEAYRDELVDRFDLDPDKKVRAYSKGNRQKVLLIAALMTRPDLLVLDEPTSGLDPLMEQAFRHCIHEAKERGQTVFLSSHILSEVEALCDRVAILRDGRLVEMGTLAEMRHLAALTVEATFDGPVPDLSAVPGVSRRPGRRHDVPLPGAGARWSRC